MIAKSSLADLSADSDVNDCASVLIPVDVSIALARPCTYCSRCCAVANSTDGVKMPTDSLSDDGPGCASPFTITSKTTPPASASAASALAIGLVGLGLEAIDPLLGVDPFLEIASRSAL